MIKPTISTCRAVWRWLRCLVRSLWARWKYRNVDPDLCCCGCQMSQAKPWDSICAHGGCRSMKEYCISSANRKDQSWATAKLNCIPLLAPFGRSLPTTEKKRAITAGVSMRSKERILWITSSMNATPNAPVAGFVTIGCTVSLSPWLMNTMLARNIRRTHKLRRPTLNTKNYE